MEYRGLIYEYIETLEGRMNAMLKPLDFRVVIATL